MANDWEKAISILAWNFNSGLSYPTTTVKTLLNLVSTGRNYGKMHLCAPPAATAAAAAATLIDENSGLGLGEPW